METTRVGKYKSRKWADEWLSQRIDETWDNTNKVPYRFQKCTYLCDCCTHIFRGNTCLKAPYKRTEIDMVHDLTQAWKHMQPKLQPYNRKEDWSDWDTVIGMEY